MPIVMSVGAIFWPNRGRPRPPWRLSTSGARRGYRPHHRFAGLATDYGTAKREPARLVAADRPRLIRFAGIQATRDAGRIHALAGLAGTAIRISSLKIHGDEGQPSREVCAGSISVFRTASSPITATRRASER
jgi:hypothetical protein